MRKLILYIFVVLLPAVIVGVSNYVVFPDSFLMATIMLIVTIGVSAVFTWQSGDATPRVSRYCLCADFVIAVILGLNLAGHWILSREVSAAKQGVEERHIEEDRDLQRERAKTELDIARKQADAELAKQNAVLQDSERRRLRLLPPDQRRSTLQSPKAEASKVPLLTPMSLVGPSEVKVMAAPSGPRMTPDQVREKWWWRLTGLAIAEVLASVVAGGLMFGLWEWDRNHDGIPDHLQRYSRGPDLPK
jgi:hypothetical protein